MIDCRGAVTGRRHLYCCRGGEKVAAPSKRRALRRLGEKRKYRPEARGLLKLLVRVQPTTLHLRDRCSAYAARVTVEALRRAARRTAVGTTRQWPLIPFSDCQAHATCSDLLSFSPMSRTQHRRKDPSHEYWTRRPFNRCGQIPGPFAKHRTHKAERQQGKRFE